MAFGRAFELDELWDGEMAPCVVDGRKVLLVRLGETVCAYADRCAHLSVPLSEGQLEERVITCSAHHCQYDALTGRGINPKTAHLTRYPVRIEGGAIWVDVADELRGGSPDGGKP